MSVQPVEAPRRALGQLAFPIVLIVAGVIGWWAAFALTLDKIAVLKNPSAVLDCNVSVLVQCGKNLGSWQGSLLGFPNPLIGLAAWVAPILVGVSILAGATFARWYWMLFNLGMAGAMVFILWLSSQSIWVLGTLCPWCMLTWSVVIPLFLTVTARNASQGVFGDRIRPVGRAAIPWLPLATIVCYLVIAAEAAIAFGL